MVTYLLDSNVLIDYTSKGFSAIAEKRLDLIFDAEFYYSIISRLEVLGFEAPEHVLISLDEFLSIGTMHALSDEIADKCIIIRRKNPKIKLPDAIIAATAIHHNHVLLTANLNDFKAIDGLNIDNPKLWKS